MTATRWGSATRILSAAAPLGDGRRGASRGYLFHLPHDLLDRRSPPLRRRVRNPAADRRCKQALLVARCYVANSGDGLWRAAMRQVTGRSFANQLGWISNLESAPPMLRELTAWRRRVTSAAWQTPSNSSIDASWRRASQTLAHRCPAIAASNPLCAWAQASSGATKSMTADGVFSMVLLGASPAPRTRREVRTMILPLATRLPSVARPGSRIAYRECRRRYGQALRVEHATGPRSAAAGCTRRRAGYRRSAGPTMVAPAAPAECVGAGSRQAEALI